METYNGDVRTKFTDDLGNPLVGGKVYTYYAGTSTPKDSYQDREFAVPNSNPIILDDAGSCDFYLDGLYRIRVLDANDVFVEERDYVTQGDSTGSSIVDNANAITQLKADVQTINNRSVLKLDENNFIIGHGSANSATVYDPSFRVDRLKVAKSGDAESEKLLFNTYEGDTTVEGVTVKAGSYIDPDMLTQPLIKNWQDVERAALKGTKKDSRTKLLIKSEDSVPSEAAASRLVGTSKGRVPLSEDIQYLSRKLVTVPGNDPNNTTSGDLIYSTTSAPNTPPYNFGEGYWYIETVGYADDNLIVQTAYNIRGENNVYSRKKYLGTWTEWKSIGHTESTYRVTTATASNVVVESDGTLKRSSSSEKYKNIISPLQLDDESYQNAITVKPIIYRSKADGDPKDWHYMSFSAEQLGEYDPCLTQWKTHETDPETGERVELEQKEAEGINLNAICAVLHATNIYQDKKLKELEARIEALEGK